MPARSHSHLTAKLVTGWLCAPIIKVRRSRTEIRRCLGDGGPPYLVRWEDGHEAEIFPGSDVFIQHFEKPKSTE